MTPTPFSDEEIERAIVSHEAGRRTFLGDIMRQLLSRCQTAEAQLREREPVVKAALALVEHWTDENEQALVDAAEIFRREE